MAGDTPRTSWLGWVALVYVLLVYPIIWGNFGSEMPGVRELVTAGSRRGWMTLWTWTAGMEWLGFLLCWAAVRREPDSGERVGLAQIGWASRRPRIYLWAFLGTLVFFTAVILARQAGYYLPAESTSLPKGYLALFTLTSTPERFFWLGMSLTAGICEETMYRGFALTYLKRLFGWLWPGVLLATFAFAYFHGGFSQGVLQFTLRFAIGLGFVGIYLWRKSLLPAILLHYLIDASLTLAR